MKSKLAICAVNENCVRWLLENGDQGDAVGDIAKASIEKIEALVSDAAERADVEDLIFYTVELAGLIWYNENKSNKKTMKRTASFPGFRYRGRAATMRSLTYLRQIEKLSGTAEPLPEWASKALLERWKSPPGWRP